MKFEWDKDKNARNKRKHGISFELATLIFQDPHLISMSDHRYDEERWSSIGRVDGVVLYVAHVIGGDDNDEEIIRIISARAATPSEERGYYTYR